MNPGAWGDLAPSGPGAVPPGHRYRPARQRLMLAVTAALALVTPPAAFGGDAEDRRLDSAQFRQGLKDRGLTELLELYLKEAPPDDPLDRLLLERDLRRTQYQDAARPAAERRRALLEANRTLERIIAEHDTDARIFDWRIELGRALLYEEAEPYTSAILYRGGTAAERQALTDVMERALLVFGRLRVELGREAERIEQLPAPAYERAERSGHVERIERMAPQAAYMERWAHFYRALVRDLDDPVRASELGRVLDDLTQRSGLLDASQNVTHVQAPTQLLAGMTARLLGDPAAAASYLDGAVNTVRRISDEAERAELQWVVRLALLERVRVERDARQFERAQRALQEFESYIKANAPEDFGLRLVAALVEGSVRQEQARLARAGGDADAAQRFEQMRFEPLMKLARQQSTGRDEVYAAVYAALDPQADPATLHPFAACAVIAGLLNEAARLGAEAAAARNNGEPLVSPKIEELDQRRLAALDRAIVVGGYFHDHSDGVPADLRPEVTYNLGVAQLQRGLRLEAARMFLSVARDYRQFPQASLAATAAVQVASEMADDPSLRQRSDIQALYLDALNVLTGQFPHTDDARYWQFFLAQLLHDLGRYDEAAVAFAQVEPGHEYYIHAAFLRIRALAASLRDYAARSDADAAGIARRVTAVVEAADALGGLADAARAKHFDDVLLRGFLAEAELFAAEALLDLGQEQSPKALARLEGFEQRYPEQSRLIGRVLRVRIIAYEHLDRLADAERTLPEYVRSDPDNAGPTLQALFESMREDIERSAGRAVGRDGPAEGGVRAALGAADPSVGGELRRRGCDRTRNGPSSCNWRTPCCRPSNTTKRRACSPQRWRPRVRRATRGRCSARRRHSSNCSVTPRRCRCSTKSGAACHRARSCGSGPYCATSSAERRWTSPLRASSR